MSASPRAARLTPYLYLLGSAVQGLASVVVQPFSIHAFGGVRSANWEAVSFAIAIMQVGLVVFSAGFPLAITRAWLEPVVGPTNARAVNGFNGLLAVGGAGLATLVAFLAGAPTSIVASLWSMGALAVVVAAQAQLRAQNRPLVFVCLAAGSSLLAHFTGLSAVLLLGPSAAHFMGGYVLATTLTALAGILITGPTWPQRAPEAVRTAVRAALPLLPHSLAIILLMQGDSMVLKRWAPPGDTGVYLAASVFALGPISVIAGLNNSWSAAVLRASHQDEETFRKTSVSTLRTASRLALGMSVLGSVLAPLVVLVIAQGNPGTTDVAIVLPAVGVGYALYIVATNILFGRLKTKAFYWVTPSVAVVCAVLAWWPAEHGNLVGVAAVKVLAFTLLGLAYCWAARREARLPVLPTLMSVLLAAAVAAGTLGVVHALR